MPTLIAKSPISVVAAPSSRCARQFTLRRTREEGNSHELCPENELPLLRRQHCRRRWRTCARPRTPVRRRAGRARPSHDARGQCLGGNQARRHRGHPRRALGDGPRHADRSLPARCRRAGVQLGQGHLGISDSRPERRPQARVGRLLHRRQPRHPHVARIRAPRRCRRTRDAQAGGRQRMEGSGFGAVRRQGRHHAQGVEPQHHLRQGRGCGRQGSGA